MVASWATPADFTTGHKVTAAEWNAELGENGNMAYLKIKEIWVPVTSFDPNGGGTAAPPNMIVFTTFPVGALTALNAYAEMVFKCPPDFLAIIEAKIVVIVGASQASANWDIYATFGAIGESYNANTANNTATTYNVTANKIYGVDASGILASMAAGDFVGLKILESTTGHDCSVLGFYLKYN